MKKSQEKGFSIVEILLILVVVGLVGLVGWYVWDKNSQSVSNSSSGSSLAKLKNDDKEASVSNKKSEWKTVSENGLTISYPQTWDATDKGLRLQINGKMPGDYVNVGFGAPLGFRYTNNGTWEYVDLNDNTVVDNTKPMTAPANVTGADSTILVSGGDGGCGGRKIAFAYKGALYAISLPYQCDSAIADSAGISWQVIEKDLAEVIKSIRVN